MSNRTKSASPAPVSAPDAVEPTESTPTDAEIEAMVAAGDVTATVDGVEVEVVGIDLAGAPEATAADLAVEADPERIRALIEVPVLALGAPGTIAKQDADGNWYAALPEGA